MQLKYMHNEVVFDVVSWVANLPSTIEAFFIQPGSSAEEAAQVRTAHAAFRHELRAPETPLLLFDASAAQPFALGGDVE